MLDSGSTQQHVTFSEWLQGRRPQHLSTNLGTDLAAFQTWRNFKEAFAPELIARAAAETSTALRRTVKYCIDPFGGSGTTAIACQFLGIAPVTIEVNPYLADLIEAKVTSYNVARLIADFEEVMCGTRRRVRQPYFPGAPLTFVEPGISGRFLFYRPVAERLARLVRAIENVRTGAHRRLMRALLGSVALEVSNAVVSGKGRRYRSNWQERAPDPDCVAELFERAFSRVIYEIRRYRYRATTGYEVIRGDARRMIPAKRMFDLAVFSPPYPNSFDYTDVYNIELWVCGYLSSSEQNRVLRLSTLRSHVQIKRSFDTEKIASSTLRTVYAALEEVRDKLWNRRIPEMVNAYFADFDIVLCRLERCLRADGRAYIVVGDSRYEGVQVPVSTIIREIAKDRGFGICYEEPFRSMRSSPQQGGQEELAEKLLVIKRR